MVYAFVLFSSVQNKDSKSRQIDKNVVCRQTNVPLHAVKNITVLAGTEPRTIRLPNFE